MMRIASVLLVAVLLTTCAISGTFAKYVTENSGISSARVAKWGVEITASGDAFSTQYKTDDTTTKDSAILNGNSVISCNTDNLVAPGTKGNLTAVKITGTPEVAVRITNEAEVTLSNNWADGSSTYYCPLVITVNNQDFYGMNYPDASAFAAAVKAAIDSTTKEYAANTNLSDKAADAVSVSWAWAFENGDTVGKGTICDKNNDAKDTDLGNRAVNNDAATVSISIKTTATQID